MKARSLFRRIICVALGAALAGSVVTGCKKGDDMFPSIVTESSESSASEVTDETGSTVSDSDIQHIRVALPYSDQTIQYLASMLYCKNNGITDLLFLNGVMSANNQNHLDSMTALFN